MLSDLGKRMRILRVENSERLLDMSKKVNKSVAFLSAVERGAKAPPQGFEEDIIKAYRLSHHDAVFIRNAANAARKTFVVEAKAGPARNTAAMFARRINELSCEQLDEINAILDGEKPNGKGR